jgi:hypothetical protein
MALKSLKTDTLNTVGDVNGLVHIETVTFAGVSSQSINDVFNSDYTFYKVLLSIFGSANTNYRLRLGTSGTPDTGSHYFFVNYLQNTSSTQTTSSASNQTSWFVGSHSGSAPLRDINTIEIANPNVASRTNSVWSGFSRDASRMQNGGGFIEQDTQYTDLFIIPDTGTISGRAQVYGYNQ